MAKAKVIMKRHVISSFKIKLNFSLVIPNPQRTQSFCQIKDQGFHMAENIFTKYQYKTCFYFKSEMFHIKLQSEHRAQFAIVRIGLKFCLIIVRREQRILEYLISEASSPPVIGLYSKL